MTENLIADNGCMARTHKPHTMALCYGNRTETEPTEQSAKALPENEVAHLKAP